MNPRPYDLESTALSMQSRENYNNYKVEFSKSGVITERGRSDFDSGIRYDESL